MRSSPSSHAYLRTAAVLPTAAVTKHCRSLVYISFQLLHVLPKHPPIASVLLPIPPRKPESSQPHRNSPFPLHTSMSSASEHREELLPVPASNSRSTSVAPTDHDSVRTKYAWLVLYFTLNLALTLYNKAVMGKVLTSTNALTRSLLRPVRPDKKNKKKIREFKLTTMAGFSSRSLICSRVFTRPAGPSDARSSTTAAHSSCQD
jgi:hypothetical protein